MTAGKKGGGLSSAMNPQTNTATAINLGPSPALGKKAPGRPPEFQGVPILQQKDGGTRSTITSKK